jgi:hypothetical protein
MFSEQPLCFLLATIIVAFYGPAVHVFVFIVLEVAELLSGLGLHACGAPSRVAAGRQAMIADLLLCPAFGIVMLFWSWGGPLGCRLK